MWRTTFSIAKCTNASIEHPVIRLQLPRVLHSLLDVSHIQEKMNLLSVAPHIFMYVNLQLVHSELGEAVSSSCSSSASEVCSTSPSLLLLTWSGSSNSSITGEGNIHLVSIFHNQAFSGTSVFAVSLVTRVGVKPQAGLLSNHPHNYKVYFCLLMTNIYFILIKSAQWTYKVAHLIVLVITLLRGKVFWQKINRCIICQKKDTFKGEGHLPQQNRDALYIM